MAEDSGDDEEPSVNLNRLNKPDLLEMAIEAEIEGAEDMTKAQLIEALS